MDKKVLLSTLWIFLVVNFIFCDVFGLHHAEYLKDILNGSADGIQINQEFLLYFSIVMEIPMAMILVSRFLTPKYNRILNITFGILLAIIQAWSLTVGSVTLHYCFFSVIEIATCISIVWIAWKWKRLKPIAEDL
jgi:hypothetical protein